MKIVLFANTDWYLYNFRLSLAKKLRGKGHEVIFLSPHGEYGERIIQEGFRWDVAPMSRRGMNPVKELRFLLWLNRWMGQVSPDVVHSFTIKSAIYGSLIARTTKVSARVNAVAGLGYIFTSQHIRARLLRPVVRNLMRVALTGRNSRLILQNPDDVNVFKKASIVRPDHIRLIMSSGVDCERFKCVDRSQRHGQPVRVLMTARLLWDKGVAEFVGAARMLKAQLGEQIEFVLAGSPDPGNPASVTEEEVKSWVAEGIVTWLGHVDNFHMPELMSSADIFVLPSYYGEGLPRTLIEAGACGLPLVTTDIPGCREAVNRPGENGIIVSIRDEKSLADAILLLHQDRDLRERLGKAALEHVQRNFDEKIVLSRTIEVYRELI